MKQLNTVSKLLNFIMCRFSINYPKIHMHKSIWIYTNCLLAKTFQITLCNSNNSIKLSWKIMIAHYLNDAMLLGVAHLLVWFRVKCI